MPFLVLSANATGDAERECKRAGVDAFLTKPVEAKVLLATVVQLTSDAQPSGRAGAEADRRAKVTAGAARPSTAAGATEAPGVLDIEVVERLAVLGTSPEFLPSLVDGFVDDASTLLRAMAEALRGVAYEEFRDHAHALAGAAGSIGATELFNCARQASHLGSDKLSSSGTALLSELWARYRAAQSALREYLSRHATETRPAGGPPH
jgi:two-component system sensor histidine kinase RpfC